MAQQCERGLKDEGLSQQKRVVRVTCSGTIFTAEALRLAAARCLTFLCYLSADVAAATSAGLIVYFTALGVAYSIRPDLL